LLTLARDFGPQLEDDPLTGLASANLPTLVRTNFTGSNLNVNYELPPNALGDAVTITSISAWAELVTKQRDIDADFSPIPVIRTSLIEPMPYTQVSQELRLSASNPDLFGFGHGFEFVAGLFYYEAELLAADRFELEDLGAAAAYFQQAEFNNNGFGGTFLPGQGGTTAAVINQIVPLLEAAGQAEQAVLTRLDQQSDTMAIFGQLEHFFYPKWAVIAGLRLGRETKRGSFDTDVIGQFVPVIANAETFTTVIEREEDEFSPKLGLKWEPVDDLNVYGTWSRGFKSGGFNAIALNDDTLEFDPERAESYELGAKARVLGGAMQLNAALFTTDFSNLQVSSFDDASFVILNAAEARSQGFELDINWFPPIPGTMLFASAGYTDARFLSYPNAPAPAGGDAMTQDLAGGRLPISPQWSASLVPSFTALIPGVQWGVNAAVDVLYRGDRFLDIDLDQRTLQRATTEINARITVGDLLETWNLTIAGRNLTDERILDQVLDQPLSPGNFSAIRGDRGRFVSANLSLNF
ncbi:TonB-dependent receptor, partial [bacterium]|nr:TonB-dependent receptor [bacterium]